jgi:hypothetical protein
MYRRDSLSALGVLGDVPDTVEAMERNRQRWSYTRPPRRKDGKD